VSAAYYAVFHLLTMTAAESWAVGRERPRFARVFDHGKVKTALVNLPGKLKERLRDNPSPDDRKTADTLRAIAKEFVHSSKTGTVPITIMLGYGHTPRLTTSSSMRTIFT